MFQKASSIFLRDALGLRGRKFFLLFLILLATLLVYPYAESNGLIYFVFRLLGSLALVLSVFAVSLRRSVLLFALVFAVPALVHRNLLPRPDAGVFGVISTVLNFAFDVFIITVIFRRVFSHDKPNSETIFGALCVYLMIGFTFASVYQMLSALNPHAFYLDPMVNVDRVPDRFDLLFYSFTSLTALGSAGMIAVSRQARSFTVIESIVGVLFLAVLVARLMGAYRPSPGS
jgi:Ion channel